MVDLKVSPTELKAFLKSLEKKSPDKEPKGSRLCEDCIYYSNKSRHCGIVNIECVNSPARPNFRGKN